MREFFIGLLVIIAMAVLGIIAMLSLPLLLVLGVFLRWIIYLAFIIASIWLVGKVTVMAIGYFRKDRSVEVIDEDEYRRRHLPGGGREEK